VANGLGEIVSTPLAEASAGQRGAYAVRPERVRIFSAGDVCELDNHFQGTVSEHLYLGDVTVYKIALDNGVVLEALLANSASGRTGFLERGAVVGVGWHRSAGVYLRD